MKKIFWLTSDFFLDVDLPIVAALKNRLSIDWHIHFSASRLNTYDPSAVEAQVVSPSVRVHVHQNRFRFRDPRNLWYYFRLCLEARRGNYDAFYFDDYGFPYLFFLVFLLLDRKKVIYAAHDVEVHSGFNAGHWIQRYQGFIFSQFQNFHVFSRSQAQLLEASYPGKRVAVVPLCNKDYGPMPDGPKPQGICNFLFFGTIRPNKGLHLLIEAANRLAELGASNFRVIIAGKCDDWANYENLIRRPEVFDVRLGVVPNNEIPALFHEAHGLVLPYLDVTQSGPMYVALNYGVPVLAPRLPGFIDFLDHQLDPLLFDRNNVDSLLDIMTRFTDEKFRTPFVSQTLKKQEEHTAHHLHPSYTKMFDGIS